MTAGQQPGSTSGGGGGSVPPSPDDTSTRGNTTPNPAAASSPHGWSAEDWRTAPIIPLPDTGPMWSEQLGDGTTLVMSAEHHEARVIARTDALRRARLVLGEDVDVVDLLTAAEWLLHGDTGALWHWRQQDASNTASNYGPDRVHPWETGPDAATWTADSETDAPAPGPDPKTS